MTNLNWTPNANTVAYYTLDGDINDHSGNGYNMSSRLGTITYGTLSGGKSYGIFDGNTIVSTTNKTTVSTGTVNAWVNYQGNGLVFMDNENVDNSNNYVSMFVSVGDYWTIYSPSTFEQTTTAPGSGWNLLTATQDGNKLIFYINGTKIQEWNSSAFLHSKNGNQWCIGGQARGTQYYDKLNGYISDIIIENKVRTEEEVRAYYNQTCTDYGLQPIQTTKYIDRYYLNGELYGIKFAEPGWQPGVNTLAYYPLNSTSTVSDMSGNNYILTNTNTTFGTYGGVDCASLNGSSSKLESTISLLPQGNSARTMQGWIYYTGNIGRSIMGYGANRTKRGCFELTVGGTIGEGYGLTPYHDDLFSNDTTMNQWVLVTCTYDGTYMKIYVNGVLKNTSNSISLVTSGINFEIGNPYDTNYFEGYISNIIIEDKERTAQEVADYFNQTKSLYGIS